MAESAHEIANRLKDLTAPGARDRLVAKGLARGIIWREGQLPSGSPRFPAKLTTDLLDHGYVILSLSLRLRDLQQFPEVSETAFRVAAEAIEAAVRRGEASDLERGFHLIVAAAAFHIGHYAARSFCLVPLDPSTLNLSASERALAYLMRRSLRTFRVACSNWLSAEEFSDEAVTARLEQNQEFTADDALSIALTRNLYRGLALFDHAIESGDRDSYLNARRLLQDGIGGAGQTGFVPHWWINTLARHLIDDLWGQCLHLRLPILPDGDDENRVWNEMRHDFISSLIAKKVSEVELWPSQIEAAARAVDPTDNLVVALPTSSGKTKIAELCILRCLASGRRVVYVTPLRALSAQLERVLGNAFRPLGVSVSSLYGASGVAVSDIGALQASRIVVATPEKLDFAIRQQPDLLNDIGLIVLGSVSKPRICL